MKFLTLKNGSCIRVDTVVVIQINEGEKPSAIFEKGMPPSLTIIYKAGTDYSACAIDNYETVEEAKQVAKRFMAEINAFYSAG